MPRYEQLKAKSKGISYTRQIKNESKEINLKKPLMVSIIFIIFAAVVFTVLKKYSPMVDIAIKDFFSINHKEALVLESDGVSEDAEKMSFLNKIPLFNFFIKTDTNETLSVMTYETNSKIEAFLEAASNSYTNSNIISRESLLPFFNQSGSNNSILYDSSYIDYGNNHDSVLFANSNINNNISNNSSMSNNSNELSKNYIEEENEKTYNYLEQMILENRNNNSENKPVLTNNRQIKNNNASDKANNANQSDSLKKNNNTSKPNNSTANTSVQNKNNSEASEKSIFHEILKPKNNTKRETTTMKPASTTTFSTKAPPSYINNSSANSNTDDKTIYRAENESKEINEEVNNTKKTNEIRNSDIIKNNSVSSRSDKKEEYKSDTRYNNSDNLSRKEIIQSSIYTMTNSLNQANIDYNRVINDMVNPNNNTASERTVKRDDTAAEETIEIINNNTQIKNDSHSDIIKNTDKSYKKEIMKKAQQDIDNYNRKKSRNNITRDSVQRELKKNNDEGIYLVEYSENTGSITLIFRERKFKDNSSVEEAIRKLLAGATDEENNRNIISCIPRDTELLDIFVEGDTVYLNFNENFEFNPLGNEGTMVQIYQFVYTATQFEGIDNVIFLINGQLNETIGAEGAIENMPFRRFE